MLRDAYDSGIVNHLSQEQLKKIDDTIEKEYQSFVENALTSVQNIASMAQVASNQDLPSSALLDPRSSLNINDNLKSDMNTGHVELKSGSKRPHFVKQLNKSRSFTIMDLSRRRSHIIILPPNISVTSPSDHNLQSKTNIHRSEEMESMI